MPVVVACQDLASAEHDCIVVVTDSIAKLSGKLKPLGEELTVQAKVLVLS